MHDKTKKISHHEFSANFPDEESARRYFTNMRWGHQVECPYCESKTVLEQKSHKPMPYRCKDCKKYFSVRTNSELAESRLPLHTWLMAIHMLTTIRENISSIQMAKELDITQKTALLLSQRIHECWLRNNGKIKS